MSPGGPAPAEVACGIAPLYTTANQQFVIGGHEADKNRYPWQVLLNNRQYSTMCGGSILAQSWIVTAAHCVVDAQNAKLVSSASRVLVSAGAHKYSDRWNSESGRQEIYGAEIIVHEGYNGMAGNLQDDIALIKLRTPLTWSDKVRPICLPDYDISDSGSGSKACMISGWGKMSGGSTADVLQMTQVPVFSQQICQSFWGYSWFTDNNVCAGQTSGSQNVCSGDSGGPLACQDTVNDPFILHGVTSYVSASGLGCAEPNKPGVFTKVVNFRNWIADKTDGAVPA